MQPFLVNSIFVKNWTMRKILIYFLTIICLQSCKPNKSEYLEKNRFDLTSTTFTFPQKDFKIIGFGAYHGSAKTELAENILLKSLTKTGIIKYYLPETDFSLGHYFNQYLENGDTLLLADLVKHYGSRVPQEKSIESYKKWKELKSLNDSLTSKNKLNVVGIDLLVTYKYTSKHILELIDYEQSEVNSIQQIVHMVMVDTTDFSPNYDSYSKSILRTFVEDYEREPDKLENIIRDKFVFEHIITNLKNTFQNFDSSTKREEIIYGNYMHLNKLYQFEQEPQFLRFGFFHIEKEREGRNPSFFTRLIENRIYDRNDVISIIGYLTESKVLWDIVYDKNQKYKTYTIEGGYGIGDYEKEYFLGIENLKKSKMSDITLFRLNNQNTPYRDGVPELIEVVMEDEKSNGEEVQGKSTTDFVDYAVLISNSTANVPIQEMK